MLPILLICVQPFDLVCGPLQKVTDVGSYVLVAGEKDGAACSP